MDPRQLDRLTRIFASILAPLTLGCGDRIDEEQFTEALCEGGSPRLLDAVEPAEALDYLELRSASDFSGESDPTTWEAQVDESSGTLCAGAADEAACTAAFAMLPKDSEFVAGGGFEITSYRSLAFTRGDDVGAIRSEPELQQLLGPIDAPGDAALLATLGSHHSLRCSAPAQVGEQGDDYVVYTRTGGGCGPNDDIEHHVVHVSADGTVEVIQTELIESGDPNCSVGRLPAGLCRRPRSRGTDPVGAFFAEVAHLEAAAVSAFGQLAAELRRHDAPAPMVRAALRSRADEVRHARVTARLARRYGGRPVAPRVAAVAPRPLLDVAQDNAAEGCIRETYGALVAHAQARRAHDPRVRRALARIARDETRHAALSWSLDAWARARMTSTERRQLDRAQADAWPRLELQLTAEHDPRVHTEAGMPGPDHAQAMFRQLRHDLRA